MFAEKPEVDRELAVRVRQQMERLDVALISGEKRVEQVGASHSGHKFQVIVERLSQKPRHHRDTMDYKATAVFNGTEITAFGYSPSIAFAKLTKRLSWAVDRFHFELNAAAITA